MARIDIDELSHLDDIRRLALAHVLQPDRDAFLRRVFRQYSEKFHTPLHLVQRLPLIEVLTHYYESCFEDLEEPEQLALARDLSESPEDKVVKQEADKADEDAWVEALLKEEQEKERVRAQKAGASRLTPRAPQRDATKKQPEPEPPGDIQVDFGGLLDESLINLPKIVKPRPPKPPKKP